MATIAQDFYLSTTDQDFTAASEVDIRKMVETAPGSDNTTVCAHPKAAGTTSITIDPYTNRSTQGDITADAGWAINRSGSDGMVATATDQRLIPAGTWTFNLSAGIPAPATTGSLSLTFVAKVYRVSSSGARSLLFTSDASNALSTTLLATSGLLTATSSQSDFILAADETIHVGYLTTMVQVAGLGSTVNANATFTVGTATEVQQVPSPGVRSNYLRTQASTGVGTTTQALLLGLTAAATGVGTTTQAKQLLLNPVAATGVGTGDIGTYIRLVPQDTVGVGTTTRASVVGKTLESEGVGTPEDDWLVRTDVDATGLGTPTQDRSLELFRGVDATGVGTPELLKAVIFVRTFNVLGLGAIGSRIALDWDDLPDAGAGPVVTRTSLFVFDD